MIQAGRKESTRNFNRFLMAKGGVSATAQNRWELHTQSSLHPLSGPLRRPLLGAHEKNGRRSGRPERASLCGADVEETSGRWRKAVKP